MVFHVERRPDGVAFIVSDPPAHYEKWLEESYYVRRGDDLVRTFDADTPYIDQISECYREHAAEWLGCAIDHAPARWEDALEAVCDRLEDTGIEWFVAGSCAMALRGLDVQPGGVDLFFRTPDMDRVRDLFRRETIQPICGCEGWVAEGYGMLFVHAPVRATFGTQPCFDDPVPIDAGPYAAAHLEEVCWRERTVRVPPMELCRNINERRGRADRVRMIDEYLAAR